MTDAETLNLFVRKTDSLNQFNVAVDDQAGPSKVVDFYPNEELQTALLKLHARGANNLFKDIPSQEVVTSFIGETLYHHFIDNGISNPVSTAIDQFFQDYGDGPHRIALHLPRSLYFRKHPGKAAG